jgi:FkbM family methyltransferase
MISKQFDRFKKIITDLILFIFSSSYRKIFFFKRNIIKSQNFRFQKLLDGNFQLTTSGGLKVISRDTTHSDYMVFNQVIVNKEYQFVLDFLNFHNLTNPIIVDCGANVGYTSLFFLKSLPNSMVFAVEPSLENAKVLIENLRVNNFEKRAELLVNGIHSEGGMALDLQTGFRDSKDWSFRTQPVSNGTGLTSITIAEIQEKYKIKIIDFLKIDIEGAEQYLFTSVETCAFLNDIKVVSIEIHEEFISKSQIELWLKFYQFIIFQSGEITIGINKKFF